jgi:hypothetical protein
MAKVTRKLVKLSKALAVRLRLFDEATARQAKRQRGIRRQQAGDRGWTRADLYARGVVR